MRKYVFDKIRIFLVIMFLLYLQQFQLSYSVTVGFKNNLMMDISWVLLNMLIVAIPFSVLVIIIKRLDIAILINSFIVTILCLINYHVLVFHGSPFLASDFFSIRTAMNVISEYDIIIDSIVLRLVAVWLIEIIIWLVYYFIVGKGEKIEIKKITAFFILSVHLGCIAVLFFGPFAIFKTNLVTWSWGPAMNKYGYGICFFNSISLLNNHYNKPDNYNVDQIQIDDSDYVDEASEKDYPDIIFVLNETLCDINTYSNISESREIFDRLNHISGVISGCSVSSLIGGGTNNSEYELLTSNSMEGLNISAPFTVLNMTNANSIVSYLNDLGYVTSGMHCGGPTNYSRNRAYNEMGFDNILLGPNDFENYTKIGNRPWLDSDNYMDMIRLYEECGEGPRFMYLLTYQNHGGYEQNDSNLDTIHIQNDFGDLTDDVNEYLTSVDKSVTAFEELIKYYENQERDVIIFMMGDHAPSFISNLPAKQTLSSEQQELAKRTVPYYVWSNREIDTSVFSEYISMVDVVPLILSSVDMPLTGYYKSIAELNKNVPVRTNAGMYMDAEGNIGTISLDNKYYDKIQNYYYLEYNNVSQKEDYHPEWFELRND